MGGVAAFMYRYRSGIIIFIDETVYTTVQSLFSCSQPTVMENVNDGLLIVVFSFLLVCPVIPTAAQTDTG